MQLLSKTAPFFPKLFDFAHSAIIGFPDDNSEHK